MVKRVDECPTCPNCGKWHFSQNVEHFPATKLWTMEFKMGKDFRINLKKCECTSCGHKWIEEDLWD
ncbi:MAG: hypothetical protein Q7K54_03890 [Candidatus Parcubacteria bacterium]|nr:hypothetical protein [Candidatus Parcubacteria bacterium]